jgi:hypothetical protein
LKLRLYVAGNAPNSVRAIANARAICREHFDPACVLEIVDLLLQPRRALRDEIIVIPTLLRLSPGPARRVIGNLSDVSQVLAVLESR